MVSGTSSFASGNVSKASSAMYLRYFIVKPLSPFVHSAIRGCDSPSEALHLFVSCGAPTSLNSDRGEKLREDEWLISAILREINHLDGGTTERNLIQSVILSAAGTSRNEVPAESKDPRTLLFSGCNDLGVRSGREMR